MNCKYCHNEYLASTGTSRRNNIVYKEYYCPWCGTSQTEEIYVQRKCITQDFINMYNRKIKSVKAKIYSEFNRGLTSDLFKSYIRAGYTKFGNEEDGYRIYDDQSKLIVEADTWTEALYKLYIYNEEQKAKITNKIKGVCVSC